MNTLRLVQDKRNMNPLLSMLAMQGGQAVTNIGSAAVNNALQVGQQDKLNSVNARYNKEMTDYNMQKQLEFWEKTGYVQQVRQLNEAGLNPALLYARGGSGGSTQVATSSQASSQASGNNVASPQLGMALEKSMELKMLESQIKNIDADTKNKLATATKTEGVDTKKTESEIELLAKTTENANVQKTLLELDSDFKGIQNHIATMTMNMIVAQITYNTEEAFQNLRKERVNANISEKTEADQIKIVKQQAINLFVQKLAMENGIKLNNATINKYSNEISQNWEKLNQSEKIMKVDALIKEVDQNYRNPYDKYIRPHNSAKTAEQIDKIMKIGKQDY